MSKYVVYGDDARRELKKGIDIVANAVKVTLGPKGRNVALAKKYGSQKITKDGVTVAKDIDLKDPVQAVGAEMIKEAASKSFCKSLTSGIFLDDHLLIIVPFFSNTNPGLDLTIVLRVIGSVL